MTVLMRNNHRTTLEKISNKIFTKIPAYPLENHVFSIILGKYKNPDLSDVQIGTTHSKMNIFSKVKKILNKLIRDLSFVIGFIKIRQLARFLQQFEIC